VKKATVILLVVITAVLFIGAVEDNGNKRIIEIGFCVDGSMKWRPSKVMSDDEIIK
jgi:hypothetical protein